MPISKPPTSPSSLPVISPDRQPTPQATLSFFPPSLLPSLAEQANATPENLATLVVANGTPLYQAVIEYVALSNHHAPLRCPKESLELSSNSSDSDYRRSRIRRATKYRTASGRKRTAPIPGYRMALGLTSLVWPPPEELRAAVLAREKGNIPLEAEPLTWDKSLRVHVAHYNVGIPRPEDYTCFYELLLAIDGDLDTLKRFTREVSAWHFEKDGEAKERDKFPLYRYRWNRSHWKFEGWKRARLPKSVVLPGSMMDEILDDVKSFLSPETKSWYLEHGLPQRRSYLFYGCPGSGKTSTIRVIAGQFKLSCCFLSMTGKGFDNDDLGDALRQLPEKALIVIEDVDALFNLNRENINPGGLTFSGLLNALDGLVSVDGVLTVLTTNHIERLDKALIRGGRVDRRFLFDRPTEEMLRKFFLMYYKDAEERVLETFLKAVVERGEEEARMIPTLQQLFIKMRQKSAEECANGVREFYEKHLPKEEDLSHIYI